MTRASQAAVAWQAANGVGNVTAWTPAQQTKVTAWLRLQPATVTSGEYSSIPDQLASNPATSNSARRASVGAAANSLPIATFATNDCWSWPLASGNNSTTKRGFAGWVRFASIASLAFVWCIFNGTAGASARQTQLGMSSGLLVFNNYVSGSNGRQGLTGAVVSAGVWYWLRTMYDSSQGTEATIAKLYLNGTLQTLTFGNLGTGGTLGALPTVTGNILIGNQNDGVAAAPLNGDLGPNFYVLNADLTAAEEAQLMQFEAPT